MLSGVAGTGEKAQAVTSTKCTKVHQSINFYRQATHKWQRKLNAPITKASHQRIQGCRYAVWVAKLWQKRAKAWHLRYTEYLSWKAAMNDPIVAIKHVFGSYASQAIAVCRCESGFSTGAQNGQYLGLFQMGTFARSKYGHGYDALTQARAAYRYFIDSGRDWSPWECKPY